MCCQTCPHRFSCANMKPPCYVPSYPSVPIQPYTPIYPVPFVSKPYGLIEPIYPYPNYYTTSTPTAYYYWGRIIPVSEEEPVIIQN